MSTEDLVTSTTFESEAESTIITSPQPLVPKVSITQGIEGLPAEADVDITAEKEVQPEPEEESATTIEMKKQLMRLDTLTLQGNSKKKLSESSSVPSSPGSYAGGGTSQTGSPASPVGGEAMRYGRLLTRQPSDNRQGRAGSLSPNRSTKKRAGSCRRHKPTSQERAELEASIQRSPQSEYKIRDFFGDKPITDKGARRSLTIHPGNTSGAPLSKSDIKSASSVSLTTEVASQPGQGTIAAPATPSKTQKVKEFFRIKSPKSPSAGSVTKAGVAVKAIQKEELEDSQQPRKLSRQEAIEEDDGAGAVGGATQQEGAVARVIGEMQASMRRSLSRQRQIDEQDGDDLTIPTKKAFGSKRGRGN